MISRRPSSDALIRRGVRIARRLGGLCSVLTVVRSAGEAADSERWRALAAKLNCSFIERRSADIPGTVLEVARELGVRHIVVGESAPQRVWDRWRPALVDRLIDELPDIDVHVIARISRGSADPAPRPTPDELLRACAPPSHRGSLRVYLGYARGVGTTSAMLDEGCRRQERGTDVVVAAVDTAVRRRIGGRARRPRGARRTAEAGCARPSRRGRAARPQPRGGADRRPRGAGHRRDGRAPSRCPASSTRGSP